MDGPVIPRSFVVTKRILVNYGYTPACPGCYASANDRKHKPHTPVCGNRIVKSLAEDETQWHRIADARERQAAFLENAIKEADAERIASNQGQLDRTQNGPIQ